MNWFLIHFYGVFLNQHKNQIFRLTDFCLSKVLLFLYIGLVYWESLMLNKLTSKCFISGCRWRCRSVDIRNAPCLLVTQLKNNKPSKPYIMLKSEAEKARVTAVSKKAVLLLWQLTDECFSSCHLWCSSRWLTAVWDTCLPIVSGSQVPFILKRDIMTPSSVGRLCSLRWCQKFFKHMKFLLHFNITFFFLKKLFDCLKSNFSPPSLIYRRLYLQLPSSHNLLFIAYCFTSLLCHHFLVFIPFFPLFLAPTCLIYIPLHLTLAFPFFLCYAVSHIHHIIGEYFLLASSVL